MWNIYLSFSLRNNFCGGCFAEYDVDGQWRRCPIEGSVYHSYLYFNTNLHLNELHIQVKNLPYKYDHPIYQCCSNFVIFENFLIPVSAIQPDSPVILGQTLEGFADPIAASSFADSPAAARETIRTSVKQSKPILPSTCPNGELPWDCPADVCTNAYCSAYPQAKCRCV